MALGRPYKLPIPQMARAYQSGDTPNQTTLQYYDEVVFDYNQNRYITLSQQEQIYKLQDELKAKEVSKKQKLKSIIGYFYKR